MFDIPLLPQSAVLFVDVADVIIVTQDAALPVADVIDNYPPPPKK